MFFGKYGLYGILGIVLSAVLMGIIIFKVLKISKNNKIENYDEFITSFNLKPQISDILNIIIQTFLIISFYVMIAGFSAYFMQEWQISNYIGTLIIVVLCYITFMGNINRLIKINTILIPILILFILVLAIKNINVWENVTCLTQTTREDKIISSILNSILYTSYNSIVLIPILIPLSQQIKIKKNIIITSIITTITIIILALSIYNLILNIDIDIQKIELPTIYIAALSGNIYRYIYGIIILVSIYTSAISAGYGFLEKYNNKPNKYKKMVILICIGAFASSYIGFTNLINLLYPVFGILGLIQLILIKNKK